MTNEYKTANRIRLRVWPAASGILLCLSAAARAGSLVIQTNQIVTLGSFTTTNDSVYNYDDVTVEAGGTLQVATQPQKRLPRSAISFFIL